MCTRAHMHTHTHIHTHTYTQPFYGPLGFCLGLPGHKKDKINLDLLEQEMVSGSGISWAICKSAPWSRHKTTPASHYSVFTGWMPFLPPNQQHQTLKAEKKFNQARKSKLPRRHEYILSEWVSSFLTAHEHIIGYSVPWSYCSCKTIE